MKTKTLNLSFDFKNDTKNKRRFDEVAEQGKEVVGGLYIRKEPAEGAVKADVTITLHIPDEAPAAAEAAAPAEQA